MGIVQIVHDFLHPLVKKRLVPFLMENLKHIWQDNENDDGVLNKRVVFLHRIFQWLIMSSLVPVKNERRVRTGLRELEERHDKENT